MTASSVNGVAVLAAEPAEAGISTAQRPVHFKQIMRLLLEDGTEAYGCIHCEYTADGVNSVRPHLQKHNRRTAVVEEHLAREPIDPDRLTLSEMIAAVQSAREQKAETDRWKARALRAEQETARWREQQRDRDPRKPVSLGFDPLAGNAKVYMGEPLRYVGTTEGGVTWAWPTSPHCPPRYSVNSHAFP